jgi:signal transduction histidine kinase
MYPISGETVYVETSFNPIINDGTVIGISCIAHDITESKKSEVRIRQHNDILMEIAHTQSHELRRPVATIMGLIALFDKEDLTSQLNVEVIERIVLVCEDLDKIIHKIVEKAYELK